MSLNLNVIEEMLDETMSDTYCRFTMLQQSLINGINDEGCVLSLLRGTPHIILRLFQMVDDFTTTFRDISFVVEYIQNNSSAQLQREYLYILSHHTLDKSTKTALQQWKSFTQLSAHMIKKFPDWASNMALNQSYSSFVYKDTCRSSSFICKKEKASSMDTAKIGCLDNHGLKERKIYPLYWANKLSCEEESSVLLSYCNEPCDGCIVNTGDKNTLAVYKWVREGRFRVLHDRSVLFVYEMTTGLLLHQSVLDFRIFSLAFAKNNELWIGEKKRFTGAHTCVHLFDTDKGDIVWSKEEQSNCNLSVQFLIDNDEIVIAEVGSESHGTLNFFNTFTRTITQTWSAGQGLSIVVNHQHRRWILTSYNDCEEVRCWSIGGILMQTINVGCPVVGIAVRPKNPDLVACGVSGEVLNVNLSEGAVHTIGTEMTVLKGQGNCGSFIISYIGDGDKIVYVSKYRTSIYIVDVTEKIINKSQWKRLGYKGINSICVLPDVERFIAVGDFGCRLFAAHILPNHICKKDFNHEENILGCCLLPGGDEIVTLNKTGEVIKWSATTLEKIMVQKFHMLHTREYLMHSPLVIHPGGNFVVFSSGSECREEIQDEHFTWGFRRYLTWLKVADFEISAEHEITGSGWNTCIPDIAISKDGKKCVVECCMSPELILEYTTLVYDIEDIHNIKVVKSRVSNSVGTHGDGEISSSDIHVNGELIVTAHPEGVKLWNITNDEQGILKEGKALYARFAYHPDRVLCVMDHDSSVVILDFDGVLHCCIPGVLHCRYPLAVHLINNCRQLVVGGRDRSLQILDTQTGQILFSFFHFSSEGFRCFDSALENGILVALHKSGIYVLKRK